jgi:hypothetical protein
MMKKGDWLVSASTNFFGVARDVYDGFVDVVLYDLSGKKIGRQSPSLGGPRGFEPACSQDEWKVLTNPPAFPVKLWDMPAVRGAQ